MRMRQLTGAADSEDTGGGTGDGLAVVAERSSSDVTDAASSWSGVEVAPDKLVEVTDEDPRGVVLGVAVAV